VPPAAPFQLPRLSAAEILTSDRPLQPDELTIVLAAAREAISGRAFRLSYVPGGPGPEMLMGAAGRPRYSRGTSSDLTSFIEYTGRPARTCDGTPLKEELVIEYERKSTDDRWNTKARTATSREMGFPVFDMLAGAKTIELGGIRLFGDRVGRALVTPWTLPEGAISGGPIPEGVRQSLWIDTVSFLPLRWSLSVPAGRGLPAIPEYGLSFTYDAPLDLRPPDGVPAPDCVR
jgi:hypothetical protein